LSISFAKDMEQTKRTPSGKPFDIHERLLLFACDIVRLTQFLHTRGPIARRLSYQILDAGTSVGSNAEEADGASSHDDFIAKNRIALKEAKETRFRLRVCQRTGLLSSELRCAIRWPRTGVGLNRSARHTLTIAHSLSIVL